MRLGLLRGRGVGEPAAIPPTGIPEADRACFVEIHGVAVFVHAPMVPAAQKHQVVELGLAAVGPVSEVMRVGVLDSTAREATTAVAVVESAP